MQGSGSIGRLMICRCHRKSSDCLGGYRMLLPIERMKVAVFVVEMGGVWQSG
jgi:hypothetical protein